MAETTRGLVERLFAEQRGALRAFFLRRVRNGTHAAELTQEVYLRMLRIPHAEAIRNPEAYLYTVASNLAREHALQQQQLQETVDLEDAGVQAQLAELPEFPAFVDAETRVRRLSEVLRQLPAKCQAAVVLQYWHGLSYEQIGEQLGVSPNMVKKYLKQALLHCRRRMAQLR